MTDRLTLDTPMLDAVKTLRARINLDQSPLVRAVDRDNRRQIEDCLKTIEAWAGARPSGAPAPEGWAIEIVVSHYHDGTRDNEASHYCGSLDEANAREIFARLDATAKPLLDAALKAAASRPLEEPRPPKELWQVIYDVAANEGSILHDDTVSAIEEAVQKAASGPREEPPTLATKKHEDEDHTRVDRQ